MKKRVVGSGMCVGERGKRYRGGRKEVVAVFVKERAANDGMRCHVG